MQPSIINYILIFLPDWSHHKYSEQAKQTKTHQKEENKTSSKCCTSYKQHHTLRAG